MANIDLRPWREERREARQKQFILILMLVAISAGAIGFSWNQATQAKVNFQVTRNTYLDGKIKELDGKIKEIEGLREQREALVERMNVIQSLQGDRPIIVHVFEELVLATPDGVYFTALSRKGNLIEIKGFADKKLAISDFLRNLDDSDWFSDTALEDVEAIKNGDEVIGNNFSLKVNVSNPLKATEDNNS
jgi:type IV pilus assembly protein PilN